MRPKIVITIEGGLIQEVLANEEVDVLILNYDTEVPEEGETVLTIPFYNSVFHPLAHFENITVDEEETERIVKIAKNNN